MEKRERERRKKVPLSVSQVMKDSFNCFRCLMLFVSRVFIALSLSCFQRLFVVNLNRESALKLEKTILEVENFQMFKN